MSDVHAVPPGHGAASAPAARDRRAAVADRDGVALAPVADARPAANAGPAQLRHKPRLTLLAVATGLFMALLDTTIVNIVVPSIMDDLQTGVTTVSWVINGYNLSLAVLFLVMGRVAQRYGQRRVFVVGLVVFTLFSLACALAPTISWLIAFRVLQGVGAAAMLPVSLSILLAVFPPQRHGAAIGMWAGIGVVAAALGPSIGGVLAEYAAWEWVFYINLPIGLLAVVLTYRFVPALAGTGRRLSFDIPGIVLSGAGFFCLTLATIQGNDWGWSSAAVVGLYVAAAVLLVAWVALELRVRDPLLDLRTFRSRQFSSAMLAAVLLSGALMGAVLLLVIYMVSVLGYSEVKAAIAVTPLPATGAVLAPLSGRLVDRVSPWITALAGALCFGVGLLLMTQLSDASTWGDVAWRAVILGFGIGLSLPSLATSAMRHGGTQTHVQSSAAVNWARQMGLVLGVAVLTAVLTGSLQSELSSAVAGARQKALADPEVPALGKVMLSARLDALRQEIELNAGDGRARMPSQAEVAAEVPEQVAQAPWFQRTVTDVRRALRSGAAAAFHWPFLVASLFAFAATVPGVLVGGRAPGEA